MRRIQRVALPKLATSYLHKRQIAADTKRSKHKLDVTSDWKSARQCKTMGIVLDTLQAMMGPRQRCMYCLDSHGADIEHFRPKALFPKRLYQWKNLLLCCTECGRFKGEQFPVAGRRALLIDPTKDDPWEYLDFDPVTGNFCARFDIERDAWSVKGEKTVQVLKLDQREALSAGCLQTLRRLSDIIRSALAGTGVDAVALMAEMQQADDHGLLGWCFSDRGMALAAFNEQHREHPAAWRQCRKSLQVKELQSA
jgi:uncharacterized protein (TIGR02646 family)